MNSIIKTKNISVIYDKGTPAETRAIDSISIDINSEEFVVIFGPSGCGKSTLLYAMAGIEKNVDSGEVWIKDKNLFQMSKEELIVLHRKDIGMIFQAYNLIPTLNVIDNITLPLVAGGMDKKVRKKKAEFMLSRLGILQFSKRFPQYLSGGQQQRVAIARALITQPDIMFADEPTGNLDSVSAKIVMETLSDLNKSDKKTIVLVTHDPVYISYAHRIFYMKDGKIIKEEKGKGGEPIEIKKEEQPVSLRVEDVEIKKPEIEKIPQQPKTPLLLPEKCSINRGIFFNIRALSRYFGWHFGSDEQERFEKIMRDYSEGKILKDDFFAILDKAFKDGGMGFYKQRAWRLSNEIDEILKLSKSLKKCLENNGDAKMKADHIVEWLLNDYGGEVSSLQRQRINEAILKRIKGDNNSGQLQNALDISLEEGGAGLNWQTARNLSRKMEMILG